MNRRWVNLAAVLLLIGCTHQQTRLQSEDEGDREAPAAEVKTIGEISQVDGVFAMPVYGVGLVLNLQGTGGGVPPGPERAMLEDALRKRGVENIKELFGSTTTSLVRVSAMVPPGARKGDPMDAFVTVPDNSRTTSLRGGTLVECVLYNVDTMSNVSAAVGASTAGRSDGFLRGHAQGKAKGSLLVGMKSDSETDEPTSLRSGAVWGGGTYLGMDRAFVVALTPDFQSARTAMRAAERINETFHGPGVNLTRGDLANARDKVRVDLSIPGPYRLNPERYLRVVRLVPLTELPAADSSYVRKYEKQLLDPGTTIAAALRLEAMGTRSIPALKTALNSEFPIVRFAAAESLAYLGSPACAEELGRQVIEQPFVQAFALTALASLNESACRVRLQELLGANSPETRYGAWRALRALDDRETVARGEKFGSFWVHTAAPQSATQIHLAGSKRAEIVLFGQPAQFVAPVSVLAGPDFTLTAKDGSSECVLSRFSASKGRQSRTCSLDVADVLRALAELGGDYADAVELLRQADATRSLTCSVKTDALPKAPTVYDLARAGVQLTGGRAGKTVAPPPEIAVTPALYEKPSAPKADTE